MEVSMSKKVVALFAIIAFVAVAGYVTAMQHAGSWTGEVIDVACHSMKDARSDAHAECGAKCVKAGLPVGLLVNGTTYLLIASDHTPLNAKLAEHVGHTITVTGERYEHPGANVISVKDWKMAEAMKK
jgi:hypothetical protein